MKKGKKLFKVLDLNINLIIDIQCLRYYKEDITNRSERQQYLDSNSSKSSNSSNSSTKDNRDSSSNNIISNQDRYRIINYSLRLESQSFRSRESDVSD